MMSKVSMASPSSSLALVAFSAAILAFCCLDTAEASLMGKGRIFGSRHSSAQKPWNINRTNYYKYNMAQDEEEENANRRAHSADDEDEERNKPCVGLCYYKKLMSLEDKYKDLDELENAASDEKNAVSEEFDFEPLTTHKPCVGICQYRRLMGSNPYEKRQLNRFGVGPQPM